MKNILIGIPFIIIGCGKSHKEVLFQRIAHEIHQELYENILDTWYPACVDTVAGGYLSNFDAQFQPLEEQDKMIVTQARHLWTTSKEGLKNPDYRQYARHGFPFIQKMWDTDYGGFFQHVHRSGEPANEEAFKTAYGNAFAIYGLSAYYDVSGDNAALSLARDAFYWLEAHSHDQVNGGYFEHLMRDGSAVLRADTISSTFTVGYKDYNSSIHLLEAFTALYAAWPDSLVRARLSEMFYIVKDIIINDDHYMGLYFKADWQPVSFRGESRRTILQHARIDHVSFGHDIETAFLLLEAATALGINEQGLLLEVKAIVDQSLAGWDDRSGGLFDQGYYFWEDKVEIILDSKAWWAQAEALNTLLIFHIHFPGEGYDRYFEQQWTYIRKYLSDTANGGWYAEGLDTRPEAKNALKGQVWKSTYHHYRALTHCLELLN